MKVELNHRVRKQGKYCAEVTKCHCGFSMWDVEDSHNLIIGWFQFQGDYYRVWGCPKCFKKWYHHDRKLEFYSSYKVYCELKNK